MLRLINEKEIFIRSSLSILDIEKVKNPTRIKHLSLK
jgi:hypothetical protein